MPNDAISKWYEPLRGLVDQQSEEIRAVVEEAIETPPQLAADVDAWFEGHFHDTEVSRNTAVFNALYLAKEGLKGLLAE